VNFSFWYRQLYTFELSKLNFFCGMPSPHSSLIPNLSRLFSGYRTEPTIAFNILLLFLLNNRAILLLSIVECHKWMRPSRKSKFPKISHIKLPIQFRYNCCYVIITYVSKCQALTFPSNLNWLLFGITLNHIDQVC